MKNKDSKDYYNSGWSPKNKDTGGKKSSTPTESKKPFTLGNKGTAGRKTAGGSGLAAVNKGDGSRKVYDDARARLIGKKRKNQSYRP